MFKFGQNLVRSFIRNYTSRGKKNISFQDKNKFPEHELRKKYSDKNRVYVWGFAETGALGVNVSLKDAVKRHKSVIHHPTRQTFSDRNYIKAAASGYGFSVFVVVDHKTNQEILFGSGINSDNQLGFQQIGKIEDANHLDVVIYPTQIQIPNLKSEFKVKSIAAGRAHLALVSEDGDFYSLGNNAYGQCGREIIENENYREGNLVNIIKKESLLSDKTDQVIEVECGQDHTLLLTQNGRVLSCGWGSDGQTGRDDNLTTGELDYVGGDIKNEKIIKVVSKADTILALNVNGEVFGWGNSEYGQLNAEGNSSQCSAPIYLDFANKFGKIIDIASGGSFCMMLNEGGEVFTWGYGILGFGPLVEQTNTPKPIPLTLFNKNEFNTDCTVQKVHSGVFHMAAINSDNDLFMWGKNRFGCLGLGHTKDQFFPFKVAVNAKVSDIECGVDHNLAICKPFI